MPPNRSATIATQTASARVPASARQATHATAVAPHPSLRNGLFARGWIELERRPALAIPVSAVRTDRARPYAIRVGAAGRAEQVDLTLGLHGRAGGQSKEEAGQPGRSDVSHGDAPSPSAGGRGDYGTKAIAAQESEKFVIAIIMIK